jgi:hypothetical protein
MAPSAVLSSSTAPLAKAATIDRVSRRANFAESAQLDDMLTLTAEVRSHRKRLVTLRASIQDSSTSAWMNSVRSSRMISPTPRPKAWRWLRSPEISAILKGQTPNSWPTGGVRSSERVGSPAQQVEQRFDIWEVFGPAQHLLVCEDVGQLGEWQSLDDLGPVDQVIGVPVFRYPSPRELD